MSVVLALDPPFPTSPFVEFIQDDQSLASRPAGVPNLAPVLASIPVQVDTVTGVLEDTPGKDGFPTCLGPARKTIFSRRSWLIEVSR